MIFEAIRALMMFALSFVAALMFTPLVLHFLEKLNLRKTNIGSDSEIVYEMHKGKANTPTMAGVIIWGTILLLGILFLVAGYFFDGFANYFNFINRSETYLPLAAMVLAGLVGLADDLMGTFGIGFAKKKGGLRMKHKFAIFIALSLIGAWWFYFKLGFDVLYVPFIGTISLGWWYLPYFIFIIIAAAFSVNETDGLDGLAGGTLLFAFGALAIVAFVLGRYDLTVMLTALLGALLAFLWFNIHPARFFMGDTGSMSLGFVLGVVAMLTNTSLFLPFFAIIPVVESVSVIIQFFSKKLRKKRAFIATPIHHHFEAIGWPESQITMRFWIVSMVFTVFGLVLFFLARFV